MSDTYKDIFKDIENEVSKLETDFSRSKLPLISITLIIYCITSSLLIILALIGISPSFIMVKTKNGDFAISNIKIIGYSLILSIISFICIYLRLRT